jgi:formimidoylglutamate deiminase
MTKGYRARWLFDEDRIIEDGCLIIDEGVVEAVGEYDKLRAEFPQVEIETLNDSAIVPGLVNVHSHAFQRAIRGKTEYISPENPEDDFWSWRRQMYRAANELNADAFEEVARLTFVEMLRRGITTVGEFHYVHHQPDGTPYEDPNELAKRVIRAAQDVGIRINLLRTAYHRAGYEKSDNLQQRRFYEPDIETYLNRFDDLAEFSHTRDGVSVGFAPHSIRAVSRQWLEAIADRATTEQIPVHIHACEQPREIRESIAEYGMTPIRLLEETGLMDANLTIIHGTHLSEDDFDILADGKPVICACPTTEQNLGDGFVESSRLLADGIRIAVGSDSHAIIDLLSEMRILEYNERLRSQQRNRLVASGNVGGITDTGRFLISIGTANGAEALQMNVGRLKEGATADFVTVDLEDISMTGVSAEHFPAHWILSSTTACIRDVFVGGQAVVSGRMHKQEEDIRETAGKLINDILS